MVENKDIFRIMSPSEIKQWMAGIEKVDNRFRVDTMLNTGMRYEELKKFEPKYFSAKTRCITLPPNVTKTKRGRVVHLTPNYTKTLEIFLSRASLGFPNRSTMNTNLKRWSNKAGLNWSPNCKTFRKTWESWLIFADYDSMKVAVSQGHSQTIQIAHYQNMASCLKNEQKEVKEICDGWMT